MTAHTQLGARYRQSGANLFQSADRCSGKHSLRQGEPMPQRQVQNTHAWANLTQSVDTPRH
eukprot:5068636-Alexandrium_andersonii.AAC.1